MSLLVLTVLWFCDDDGSCYLLFLWLQKTLRNTQLNLALLRLLFHIRTLDLLLLFSSRCLDVAQTSTTSTPLPLASFLRFFSLLSRSLTKKIFFDEYFRCVCVCVVNFEIYSIWIWVGIFFSFFLNLLFSALPNDYFKFCTFDRVYPVIYSKRNSNVCNGAFDKITQHNFYNKTLVAYTLNLLRCSSESQKFPRV